MHDPFSLCEGDRAILSPFRNQETRIQEMYLRSLIPGTVFFPANINVLCANSGIAVWLCSERVSLFMEGEGVKGLQIVFS